LSVSKPKYVYKSFNQYTNAIVHNWLTENTKLAYENYTSTVLILGLEKLRIVQIVIIIIIIKKEIYPAKCKLQGEVTKSIKHLSVCATMDHALRRAKNRICN